jgi:hypothetical protein
MMNIVTISLIVDTVVKSAVDYFKATISQEGDIITVTCECGDVDVFLVQMSHVFLKAGIEHKIRIHKETQTACIVIPKNQSNEKESV